MGRSVTASFFTLNKVSLHLLLYSTETILSNNAVTQFEKKKGVLIVNRLTRIYDSAWRFCFIGHVNHHDSNIDCVYELRWATSLQSTCKLNPPSSNHYLCPAPLSSPEIVPPLNIIETPPLEPEAIPVLHITRLKLGGLSACPGRHMRRTDAKPQR